jgi:hypothetical protein
VSAEASSVFTVAFFLAWLSTQELATRGKKAFRGVGGELSTKPNENYTSLNHSIELKRN